MNSNFIVDLIKRLGSKSPRFFVTLQWISGLLAAASWLLKLLIDNDLVNNPQIVKAEGVITIIASTLSGVLLAALMPTTDPAVMNPKDVRDIKEKL